MIKEVVRIPYFKRYVGKKGVSFYFSPPSYIVKTVLKNSDGIIHLKNKKLSDDFELAKNECLEIYKKDIKPYLLQNISSNDEELPQSLRYIWRKFCERRGIGCEPKGNVLLDRSLSEQTKEDYQRQFNHISQVKSKNGKLLIDLNCDLITPQLAEKIYLQLYGICNARWSRNCMDLLRNLFNYGKNKFGVLKGQNPFQGLRLPKGNNVPALWSEEDVLIFNETAVAEGYSEIGLAVRLNWWLSQRKTDFFNINMSMLKELNGYHYFELMPSKTKEKRVKSFAPIPPDLYEEIKDRKGRLIHYNSIRTFEKHFLIVKKKSGINKKVNFETLRNTASTMYYEAGSSVTENMSVLGHLHAGTNMTQYRQNTPIQAVNALKKRLQKK